MKHPDLLALKQKIKELVRRNRDLLCVNQYSLFDKELAVDVVPDVFENFHKDIANDLNNLKDSYKNQDWIKIQMLADKMIDSASYGTVRLYVSFLLLDSYLTLGYSTSREALYTQAIEVLDDTLTELEVNKPFMKEAISSMSKNQEKHS